jgi:hypothetical protein
VAFQTVFQRYEMKYRITAAQKQRVLAAMEPYMEPDRYGHTTIRNLYYDTDTYLLARRSIEKPMYKEKLRIRSYEKAGPESTVFVELKKKYKHVVYKRRVSLTEKQAMQWLGGESAAPQKTQKTEEIDYFLKHYGSLHPTVFLSYEREAFYARDGSDFRVTFDDTILCRQEALSLRSEVYGTPILPEGSILMEIKCSGGVPIWMAQRLSTEHIYKTSFSKYGIAYCRMIFPMLSKV